jgi:probable rRNA maturation factor
MIRAQSGSKVVVSNRQRRLKINTQLLAEIAERTLELVHDDVAQLSVVLVSDSTIAKLNAQYHATSAPTDILSFDYGHGLGELIISVEHAIQQAKRFRSTPARELVLYVIHGILHLHGYNDTTPRRRIPMRKAERRLLNGLCREFRLATLIGPR